MKIEKERKHEYLQRPGHLLDVIYIPWIESVTHLKVLEGFLYLAFMSQD